jgi:predicted dehydrogenase
MEVKLRFGILGAAMIAPPAIVRPARLVEGVEVTAVAARDIGRAGKFARRHGIPRVLASYEGLIHDPDIDAVYIPLPNSHHCEWSIKALEAGKHVLCEKPVASNAAEALRMAEAEKRTGRKIVEAFHYRHHPLMKRVMEVIAHGEIGEIRSVEAHMQVPLLIPGNIRYRYDLGGGATMDLGCYCINLMRLVTGAEPAVISARTKLSSPQVDRWITADFDFRNGVTGRLTCSFYSVTLMRVSARIIGTKGDIGIINPFAPQVLYHRLKIRSGKTVRVEKFNSESTYSHQLRAFAAHVLEGEPISTGMDDAIANMRVIDSVYDAAGLRRRGKA